MNTHQTISSVDNSSLVRRQHSLNKIILSNISLNNFNIQERKVSFTWDMLQHQRASRVKLRQQVRWQHILLASIQKGSGMTCTICKVKLPTSHLLDHTPVHLIRVVRKVLKWRNRPYSLMELVKLRPEIVKEIWELYRSIFNSAQPGHLPMSIPPSYQYSRTSTIGSSHTNCRYG